jgi:hypothetical protein
MRNNPGQLFFVFPVLRKGGKFGGQAGGFLYRGI